MGEGLNGICATLQHTVKSLGLTHSTVAQAIAILMVLYFMWLLYFDGFRTRSPTRKSVSEMWLWFHFPLHLSLIIVLEGVKNLFIFVSLREAVTNLGEAFGEVMDFHIDTNGSWPEHPWLENLLLPLKMSWQQELKDLEFAEGQDPDEVTAVVQAYRWFTTALHNVYLACNEQPDPDAEYSFNYFVSRNDTVVFDDLMGDRGISTTWRYFYNVLMEYTGHWLIAVSGTLLICMAILNLMRRRPRNRFAWGYSLNRIVIGSSLIGIGGATSNWFMKDHWWYWIVPTIAISYSAASILDWLILYRSITSIFTKEAHGPDYARVKRAAWDTASRVDLERLSQFSYRGAASGRKRFTPTFYDARYLASGAGSYTAGGLYALDEVFDPYAEAGAPNYPPFYLYKPGSGGSSNDPTTQSLLETDHESGALM
ncbi:hypothetical protein FRC05_005532 [Tulasnella sp. 425]|nr:hypothetical protein FRC05_005532 [Tulasnella sp. 425]